MEANTYDLRTILTFERRYVIPTFQRDYEWTLKDQWELLFDDLEAVAERLEDARKRASAEGQPVSKAEKHVSPHFLGAVVLDQLASAAGDLDVRSVIDGQQRLTTIQLLLRGILDVLVARNSSRAPQVRRLIENPRDVTNNEEEHYKLWPRRRDRQVWQIAMADADGTNQDHPYLRAREYFRSRTETASASAGGDRTDVLVDSALSLFKLVVIDLDDNDDAQVIFEVLNGRQTPLSASDLVKNLLFMRAERAGVENVEKLYAQHWQRFDDPWWKVEMGRGHAARGRRDVLLSIWLSAATAAEANVGHLYSEVRSYLDRSKRSVAETLTDLSSYSEAFRTVLEPSAETPVKLAASYQRINMLGVVTALPLLAWLRTLPATVLAPAAHEVVAHAIESYVVRRVLIGANTRGYGKRFIDLLHRARESADPARTICEALALKTETLAWPSDDDVAHAFVSRPMYGNLNQARIRMLLGAIDDWMETRERKSERGHFDYDELQIEHLLPQAWRKHWAVDAADANSKLLAEQNRERSVNLVGNLTLVTEALNPAMSNAAWTTKRDELAKHSKLHLNRGVVKLGDWGETHISDRGKMLAQMACQVWASPESVVASPALRR